MSLENGRLMLSKQNLYEFSFASVIGTRDNQEDYFGILSSENAIAACVCDGMGGLEYGASASEMTVSHFFESLSPKIDSCSSEPSEFYQSLLEKMDHEVHNIKRSDGSYASAGCTIVSVFIGSHQMMWLSVGDSSIYHLRGESISRLNTFHNYQVRLDEQLKQGLIDREKYVKESRRGHALTSFIGIGGIKLSDISPSPMSIQKNDVIVLCSDGITNYIDAAGIRDFIKGKSPKSAVDSIMSELSEKSRGKPLDNATVIIIRIK